MYVYIPTPVLRGHPVFPNPTVHLSTQPFPINKVSFLPVTLMLQPLILESVLRGKTL
jgi:hypothetical protein